MTIRQAYENLLHKTQNNIINAQKIENKAAERAAQASFNRISYKLMSIPESIADSELSVKEIVFIYQ